METQANASGAVAGGSPGAQAQIANAPQAGSLAGRQVSQVGADAPRRRPHAGADRAGVETAPGLMPLNQRTVSYAPSPHVPFVLQDTALLRARPTSSSSGGILNWLFGSQQPTSSSRTPRPQTPPVPPAPSMFLQATSIVAPETSTYSPPTLPLPPVPATSSMPPATSTPESSFAPAWGESSVFEY